MRRIVAVTCLGAMILPAVTLADVPVVATDIAPVHSLVAQVMGELGTPELMIPPGASPHTHSMRPSEARALADADLVVWIGEGLEPWLAGPIKTLAEAAVVLELAALPNTTVLGFRKSAVFGAESGENHARDGHAVNSDMDDGHHHQDTDPHLWMDPANGIHWLEAIRDALSDIDPKNATHYAANAELGMRELVDMEQRIEAQLEPLRNIRFVVLHDAFQYFEARFGLRALGAITLGDATDPGAARLVALRDAIRERGVDCIVTEPQFNTALLDSVTEGSGAGVVVLDPIGLEHEPGAALYADVLEGIAAGFTACR